MSNSKEEILLDKLNLYEVELMGDNLDKIHNAMDEYAQQEAIDFAEWILEEKILCRDTNWFDAGKHYTLVELYQIFLKSKQQ